eukprot:jgi/Mesen1/2448/ME000158S01647
MALQAGFMGGKLLFLVGAGVTGSYLLGNTHIAELLSDLSKVLMKHLKEPGEGGDAGGADSALRAEVRRLSMHLGQMQHQWGRPVTVISTGERGGSILSYVTPVAVLGAAGYGYMWWKGFKFGDLMYVTKRGMSNAVSSVTKQLEQVSGALASTRRHLAGRLDVVTKSLDNSIEVQGLIKQEVIEVRGHLGQVGDNVSSVQQIVEGLECKFESLEQKQDFANQGIVLLCRFVMQGIEGNAQPELVKGLHAYSRSPMSRSNSLPQSPGLKELEFITQSIEGTDKKPFPFPLPPNGKSHQVPPRAYIRGFTATT